jgi:hypothetical protein
MCDILLLNILYYSDHAHSSLLSLLLAYIYICIPMVTHQLAWPYYLIPICLQLDFDVEIKCDTFF